MYLRKSTLKSISFTTNTFISLRAAKIFLFTYQGMQTLEWYKFKTWFDVLHTTFICIKMLNLHFYAIRYNKTCFIHNFLGLLGKCKLVFEGIGSRKCLFYHKFEYLNIQDCKNLAFYLPGYAEIGTL